jgi:hypothetical protein
VSPNKANFNLRESLPLPRNILHNCGISSAVDTGQRPNPELCAITKGYRSWSHVSTSPKVTTGYPTYPVVGRDSAKNGLGCVGNRHLNYLAESILVNVGGFYQDAKVCSPPKSDRSVGAVIGVGGWESQPQGEGPQGIDTPGYLIAATAPGIGWDEPKGAGCEREQDDKPKGNLGGGKPIPGKPDVLKGTSPVWRGE